MIDRKAKIELEPQPVAKRKASERTGDFLEVCLGFSPEDAIKEATRCLLCPEARCKKACPFKNNIPACLKLISEARFIEAAEKFRETSPMPEVCSRVCPQWKLCESACVLNKLKGPVKIGALERFATDYQRKAEGPRKGELKIDSAGKSVAIVGSGPAGIAASEKLAELGHKVTIFEAKDEIGGLLLYGIPGFKLPKNIIREKGQYLQDLGISIKTRTALGKDFMLDDLFKNGFDAVFLGIGLSKETVLDIPGKELEGIIGSLDFLSIPLQKNLPSFKDKKVAVIGGGNTAMDCLRTAVRLGAENVTCIYRRTEAEMPSSVKEREYVMEEGIIFEFLAQPMRFLGSGSKMEGVECQRMWHGSLVENTIFFIEADIVVLACGFKPDIDLLAFIKEIKFSENGLIEVDPDTLQTSDPRIFAGGDAVSGPDIVSTAASAGFKAAEAIDKYLSTL